MDRETGWDATYCDVCGEYAGHDPRECERETMAILMEEAPAPEPSSRSQIESAFAQAARIEARYGKEFAQAALERVIRLAPMSFPDALRLSVRIEERRRAQEERKARIEADPFADLDQTHNGYMPGRRAK